MNRMMPSTISAGAVTAAVRLIVSGKAVPIMPPPAATMTSRKVPKNSENNRRHSWCGSEKSAAIRANSASQDAGPPGTTPEVGDGAVAFVAGRFDSVLFGVAIDVSHRAARAPLSRCRHMVGAVRFGCLAPIG